MEKIKQLSTNIINQINKNVEKIVFILYCFLILFVSFFHEPWFDEIQAWEISKDSLYNILFVIPHYEGHPPLWHLILKCFSLFDIPFEIGLKVPNLLFMYAAAWLLIFKSPFHKMVRFVLPFTYFIFYQYAVISRPYSIFCFALFLIAFLYKTKNEHPFRFVGALILLCLSSFHGVLFAGGITICWLIDVLKSINIKDFIKSKICYSMWILLALVITLYFVIKPAEDVIFNSSTQTMSQLYLFLYAFLVAPLDALFTDVLNYHPDKVVGLVFWVYCVIGVLIIIPFLYVIKAYKKMCLFLIPSLLFSLFITFVYAYCHHIGLLAIFYIFVMWCIIADREIVIKNNWTKIVNCLLVFVLCVQLSWSYSAIVNEIKLPYCFSKSAADFIKQYDLDKYKISTVWYEKDYYISKSTKQKLYVRTVLNEAQQKILDENFDKVTVTNYNLQDMPVIINPYFNKNIFYTFNVLNPERNYEFRQKMSATDVEKIKNFIREQGLPDIITKNVKLSSIFSNEEIASANYVPLKQFYGYRVWKNYYTTFHFSFYARESLLEEIDLNNN